MIPVGRQQVPLRFVLMRGGTSKAVFLRRSDLPPDPETRDRVILALFGSPDPRQVDGLGGADILTSKVAIIGPPSRGDADLDYTFGQVSITEPVIDYDINCGNISAAVGVYALQEGLVLPVEPVSRVRIHNTNTGRILLADVPVAGGEVLVEGDLSVDGVPGTGAPILLDWAGTVGGATGALLPTGRAVDRLSLPWGHAPVSVVDVGNLCVFFPAEAAGLAGTEGPGEVTAQHVERSEAIRQASAKLLGLPVDGLLPIPVAVAPPAGYRAFGSGRPVAPGEVDVLARAVAGRPPVLHKAFPGTAAATVAVAARIPGTVVHEAAAGVPDAAPVRIGHPSGAVPVWAVVRPEGDGWRVERAAYARTARRLAEGYAFVRASVWA